MSDSGEGLAAEAEQVAKWEDYIRMMVALNYTPNTLLDRDDLFSVGLRAVVQAIRNYDPSKGMKLRTHIISRAHWAILHEIHDVTGPGGRKLTASTDCPVFKGSPDGPTFTEAVPDVSQPPAWQAASLSIEVSEVRAALADLSEGEREAVALYYLKGVSMRTIGKMAGLTRQGIANRIRRALPKLRESILQRRAGGAVHTGPGERAE